MLTPKPACLVTFQCNFCSRTYRYGLHEGKGVPCECGRGILEQVVTSLPKPAYKVRARISELVNLWCDVLTNNERHAYNVKAGRGLSGLNEFLKAGLKD